MKKLMKPLLFLFFVVITPWVAYAADESPGAWYENEKAAEAAKAKTPEDLVKEKDEEKKKEDFEKKAREDKENLEKKAVELRHVRFNILQKKYEKGFLDIPFGATFDDVYDAFGQKGISAVAVSDTKESMYISDYSLGEKSFMILLIFDHEKRFYSVSIRSNSFSANELYTNVFNNADYLTGLFKEKYGSPSKCQKPKILQIRDGYNSFWCQWNNKKLKIYDAITVRNFEYSAVGIIENRELDEAETIFFKQRDQKGVKEGSKKF